MPKPLDLDAPGALDIDAITTNSLDGLSGDVQGQDDGPGEEDASEIVKSIAKIAVGVVLGEEIGDVLDGVTDGTVDVALPGDHGSFDGDETSGIDGDEMLGGGHHDDIDRAVSPDDDLRDDTADAWIGSFGQNLSD